MDLSSVCRAAIAAGVSNDKESSIVAFKIVDPPKSYTGVPKSKGQRLTTLDYKNAARKFGGGHGMVCVPSSLCPPVRLFWCSRRRQKGGRAGIWRCHRSRAWTVRKRCR